MIPSQRQTGEQPPMHYKYLTSFALDIFDHLKSKGVSLNGAIIILGQSILERGWEAPSDDFNLFNITISMKGDPWKRENSHGKFKDYSNLGKYEGSLNDYFSLLNRKYSSAVELISHDKITTDEIDQVFRTGKYQLSIEERNKTGLGSFCANCDYGNSIMKTVGSLKNLMTKALNYGIKAADEFISSSNFVINGHVANLEYKTELKVQQHEAREQKAQFEGYLKEFKQN